MSYEEVREDIASEIWACSVNLKVGVQGGLRFRPEEFNEQRLIDKTPYYNAAEAILSHPRIGVIAEDQSLPLTEEQGLLRPDGRPLHLGYKRNAKQAQQDILKANFKRIEVEE